MMEVVAEATHVKHHKQKLTLIFSAMRHFAQALRRDGLSVDYVRLDDPANTGAFTSEVQRAITRHRPSRVIVTEPGEWRVMEMMKGWDAEILGDDRFFASPASFAAWARGRKQLRMELFYRDMRRASGLLMEGDEPAGGQWNFDRDNRKSLPRDVTPPRRVRFEPDAITAEVMRMVQHRFPDHFGDLLPFGWAVTREDAIARVDDVSVHDPDGAYARRGEVHGGWRAEPASADQENARLFERTLTVKADLRHDEVAAATPDLVVGEVDLRCARHGAS